MAERLSAKSVRRSKKTEFGVRHQEAVESGESRRLGRVGSVGEKLLDLQLRAEKISGYDREYQFHPTRKWRFDFAHLDRKIAVECEGGIWRQGGGAHSHPLNILRGDFLILDRDYSV